MDYNSQKATLLGDTYFPASPASSFLGRRTRPAEPLGDVVQAQGVHVRHLVDKASVTINSL